MLVGREPAERPGDAALAEPAHPGVQLPHEVLQGRAGPVGGVEGLLLEQAEEPIGAGVVAARPLARHAAGQPVRLADGDPARPAVAAAAVAALARAVVVPGAAGYLKETGNRRRRQTGRPPQSLAELAPAPHRGRKGVRASPFLGRPTPP